MRISDWSSDVCSSDLATFRDGLDVCVTSRSNLQQVLLARLQQQAAIFNPLLIHAHGALVDHAVAFCIARYQPGYLPCVGDRQNFARWHADLDGRTIIGQSAA